uniref:Uncharacterized protein n=1 Tax=Thermofilum pendens TaxID=2269 RepID=A0A7C1PC59_THEPE
MDPTLVAAGFSAYFLLLVISYMLLSNPDIDQVWGGLLLALSLLVVVIPSYYVVEEYQKLFIEFITGNTLAFAILIFFAWLFLYTFLKLLRPAKGLFSSGCAEEVIYITIAAYGALHGAYFLVANMPLGVALAVILLHLFICREVLKLAMRVRRMERF